MTYVIAVRELCAFTAKQGELDLWFSPTPTALEGITCHQLVQGCGRYGPKFSWRA
jgi:hypothetical protein